MAEAASETLRFSNSATPPGSSPYYSIRFGASGRHAELALLFAWREKVRSIEANTSDPGIARLKLDWWRGELERAASGAAQHPLARALEAPISVHRLPVERFHEYIGACEQRAMRTRFETKNQLLEACASSGGSLLELLTRINGDPDGEHAASARRLGTGVSLAELIREVGGDLRHRYCFLPNEMLHRHGLAQDGLLSPAAGEGLRLMLHELAGESREMHRGALLANKALNAPALGPAVILAQLYDATLVEIERAGFPVVEERVSLTPLRKLWIAWRAGRRLR